LLVVWSLARQRYRAVLQVQAGTPLVEVTEQCGVSRQAVPRWLRRYRDERLAGLAGRSHRRRGNPARHGPLWRVRSV